MLPPVSLAHPLDDGSAVAVTTALDATAAELGADGRAWRLLFGPIVAQWENALDDLLAPFHIPRHPLLSPAMRCRWPHRPRCWRTPSAANGRAL